MEVVAVMYDDGGAQRVYDVALDDVGSVHVRERGKRKWSPVHKGLNPTLDDYLANCEANFAWRIARLASQPINAS